MERTDLFTCPKCNQKFSFDELFNHNNKIFTEEINKKVELELQKKIKEKEIAYKQQIEITTTTLKNNFLEEKQVLNNDFKDKLNQQEIIIANKENELLTQKQSQEQTIIQIKNELMLTHNKEIEQLKLEITKYQTVTKDAEEAYQIKLNNKILETEQQFNLEKEKLQAQIYELNLANKEYKVINSKTKGENFEHEVEGELQKAFGYYDKIKKITVGVKKADYLQIINNNQGKEIGKIVYEVKNAKWSESWEAKLSSDTANNNTKYGILVATSLNEKYHNIPFKKSDEYKNLWLSDSESFIFVGQMIRKIIELEYDLTEKKNIYLNSNNSELIKRYESKISNIETFMHQELPIFIKNFKKQLQDIKTVKNSLDKNAKLLESTHDNLKEKIEKQIQHKLEQITGILLQQEEND